MERENENKKIPNTSFSVLLFLLFYLLVRRFFFCDVPVLFATWRDSVVAEDEPMAYVLIPAVLYVVWILASLWSIVRVLKGKPDAVACIRWALVFGLAVALSHIFNSLGKALTVHWSFALPTLLMLLFYVVFLVYLKKSEHVKTLFPVSKRKFAPGGWLWIIYLIVWVALLSCVAVLVFGKDGRTRKIPLSELALPENSLCDGRLLFESHLEWEVSEHELMDCEAEPYDIKMYKNENDSVITSVWSGVSEKTRHSDYMSILLQAIPFEPSWQVSEGIICDTVIGEEQYYVEQYRCENDSVDFLWTFSMRFDSRSNKYCACSRQTKHSTNEEELDYGIRFLESVVFDLTPYKKYK